MDEGRTLLRHTLATLAYRAAKTLQEVPEGFASFPSASSAPAGAVRTPLQIVAHLGDLIEWSLSAASGADVRQDRSRLRPDPNEDIEIRSPGPAASEALDWPLQVARFFAALERFDAFLASGAELHAAPPRLFQGPIADALTHVGQLALLRRGFGFPIAPESFFDADIAIGRVGFKQTAPRS